MFDLEKNNVLKFICLVDEKTLLLRSKLYVAGRQRPIHRALCNSTQVAAYFCCALFGVLRSNRPKAKRCILLLTFKI